MKINRIAAGAFLLLIGAAMGYGIAILQITFAARDLAQSVMAPASAVLPSTPDDVMSVRVIGSQYLWHFHYPGKDGVFGVTDVRKLEDSNPAGIDWSDTATADDFVATELVLPVRTPVILEVTSADVIHSVSGVQPGMGQDAIPGKEIPVWLSPEEIPRSGVLRCGQLCGAGHDQHHTKYHFFSAEELELWSAEQEKNR